MTHSTVGRVKVAGLQPAQVLAGLLGLFFLVAGVAGFLRTGFGDFAGDQHTMLFGFAVNPLHNVVHLAFGVLGLLMATSSGLSRLYGWIVFAVYGLVLVWGLALAGVMATNPVEGLGNPLALNTNDNWLHLGLAVLGLLIAVMPARRKVVVPDQEVEPAVQHDTVHDHTTHDHTIRDNTPGDHTVRDVPPVRDGGAREPDMPVQRDREPVRGQRGDLNPHDQRIESVDPTVSPRPTQPIDPAVAEQQRARHYR